MTAMILSTPSGGKEITKPVSNTEYKRIQAEKHNEDYEARKQYAANRKEEKEREARERRNNSYVEAYGGNSKMSKLVIMSLVANTVLAVDYAELEARTLALEADNDLDTK